MWCYCKFQNLTEDDPLNTILSDMGSAKAQLPYHEDISITLDLKSRWEQVPGNYMILSVIINILTIYACVPETERGTSATLLDSFCVLKKLDFPEF